MKLLYTFNEAEVLTENTSAGRNLYLEGPSVMCNAKNRNGRLYPLDSVGKPAVAQYQEEFIDQKRSTGEVNHPDYPMPNMDKAAVFTESLKWEGNNAIGKLRVLDNPNSVTLKSLIEVGMRIGTSTRGLGEGILKEGVEVIQPGYFITAVDVVDNPSGQVCYMNAVNESVEWKCESSGVWIPVKTNHRVDENISRMTSKEAQVFKKVLDHLS